MVVPLHNPIFVHPVTDIHHVRHHVDECHSAWCITISAFEHSHWFLTNEAYRYSMLKLRIIKVREMGTVLENMLQSRSDIATQTDEQIKQLDDDFRTGCVGLELAPLGIGHTAGKLFAVIDHEAQIDVATHPPALHQHAFFRSEQAPAHIRIEEVGVPARHAYGTKDGDKAPHACRRSCI